MIPRLSNRKRVERLEALEAKQANTELRDALIETLSGWDGERHLAMVSAPDAERCVLSVSLCKECRLTYFWEESPRIRRTEVRPTPSRRAISALAMPARCSVRISAVCSAAVAGRPRRLPFSRAGASPG